ncbi:AraC family transcriptional regulator [Gillisia mitskevichiae]|uniref:AraC family transcriptional regulator n=1 Tax=Gillisia mitskevichiae TaxID=270921 RepID=A0A495PW94_9FLAO|nr:helix-turn-helix domain-containing protein [Gillisia mitskevichiae]RKS53758.1 AraC family transcriptional regulator [Gillisia mitskevichiae]
MEFKLESNILEEKPLVKSFSKDFRVETLSEETLVLNKSDISGTINHIHLDGFCLIIKNIQSSVDHTINISSKASLFKLHFELEGDYSYAPENITEPKMTVSGGHFNIFYFSEIKGKLQYNNTSRKTVEILFTEDFLEKVAGKDLDETFKDLRERINKNQSFLLWEESRPIPPDVQQTIREITNCHYCTHIKKIYLEAKITALLLNFLVDSEQKSFSEDKEVSKNDLLGIQKVETYIRAHFKESISIAELAPIAGLNTSKLKQSFKKVHSTTIFKFITRLRMEMAKEIISVEKRSVSEAAYEVGYKNPQHFTVAFKKYYGYLPSSLLSEN